MNTWFRRPITITLLVALLASGLCGCGGRRPHGDKKSENVTVKVTFGGEPVTNGFVNFANPKTGLGGGGPLGEDGAATIPNVVVGDYTVTVTPPLMPNADPNPAKTVYPNLPVKFRSETTSTLKATVDEKSKSFTFELKEK